MVGKMAQRDAPSGEDGFLSRWSQRKQALREGKPLAEPVPPVKLPESDKFKPNQALPVINPAQGATDSIATEPAAPEPEAKPPAPTLEDTRSLTPQSDFKPFMRADVSPEVKNAAMKQLFKDPHFNTMDMMDIYVDDYSKPDPLPPEMLRKMAVTRFLGFWDEEEKEAAEKKAREDAEKEMAQNVAKSEPVITEEKPATPEQGAIDNPVAAASAKANTHDHPDLQLQPDDAAGREAPVRSAG
jgi:Protein of unknown function (DUF3306)